MRCYPGLSMLTLGVENLDRATQFYERLGWRLSHRASGPAISFFSLNHLVLALYPFDALRADCGAEAESFRGQSLAQNHASAEAVEEVTREALAAGARLVKAPGQASWGGFHAVVADPDGHYWEFAYNPAFPPEPDGSIHLAH